MTIAEWKMKAVCNGHSMHSSCSVTWTLTKSNSFQREWKCISLPDRSFVAVEKHTDTVEIQTCVYWRGCNAWTPPESSTSLWCYHQVPVKEKGCLGHKRTKLVTSIQASTAGIPSCSLLPHLPYPAPSLTWIWWKQAHWWERFGSENGFPPFLNRVRATHLVLWCISTCGLLNVTH